MFGARLEIKNLLIERLATWDGAGAFVDDIAYPEKAKPEMKQGVAFFNLMRNLTATGFYTS